MSDMPERIAVHEWEGEGRDWIELLPGEDDLMTQLGPTSTAPRDGTRFLALVKKARGAAYWTILHTHKRFCDEHRPWVGDSTLYTEECVLGWLQLPELAAYLREKEDRNGS